MHLSTTAIVCSILSHGEHGTIARLLTPENGLVAGYVRGGRSRRLRPILLAGNIVQAEFRARTEGQLASLTVELSKSRGVLYDEPLAAAAIEWACALTAATFPEEQSYPRLYQALDGVLSAVEAAPTARGWAASLVRYEVLLLSELGFGLDFTRCAGGGDTGDLAYVSPKSGIAVSRAEGKAFRGRLLVLPEFLIAGGSSQNWDEVFDGLRLAGHFLERDLLADRRNDVMAARERLIERLKRAV